MYRIPQMDTQFQLFRYEGVLKSISTDNFLWVMFDTFSSEHSDFKKKIGKRRAKSEGLQWDKINTLIYGQLW